MTGSFVHAPLQWALLEFVTSGLTELAGVMLSFVMVQGSEELLTHVDRVVPVETGESLRELQHDEVDGQLHLAHITGTVDLSSGICVLTCIYDDIPGSLGSGTVESTGEWSRLIVEPLLPLLLVRVVDCFHALPPLDEALSLEECHLVALLRPLLTNLRPQVSGNLVDLLVWMRCLIGDEDLASSNLVVDNGGVRTKNGALGGYSLVGVEDGDGRGLDLCDADSLLHESADWIRFKFYNSVAVNLDPVDFDQVNH